VLVHTGPSDPVMPPPTIDCEVVLDSPSCSARMTGLPGPPDPEDTWWRTAPCRNHPPFSPLLLTNPGDTQLFSLWFSAAGPCRLYRRLVQAKIPARVPSIAGSAWSQLDYWRPVTST